MEVRLPSAACISLCEAGLSPYQPQAAWAMPYWGADRWRTSTCTAGATPEVLGRGPNGWRCILAVRVLDVRTASLQFPQMPKTGAPDADDRSAARADIAVVTLTNRQRRPSPRRVRISPWLRASLNRQSAIQTIRRDGSDNPLRNIGTRERQTGCTKHQPTRRRSPPIHLGSGLG